MRAVEHLPYPKIAAVDPRTAGGPWTATEKVHGGQLVLGFDGRTLRVGKRKAWLADDEPFFGWQLLRDRLACAASAALAGRSSVRVYGELYGGAYPHPDVPRVPGASAVQTGIWYAPDIRFALFDVLRDGLFRPYAEVAATADEAGLDVVPLLGRGTRPEVDAVPVRFASRMPDRLGLPALDGNLAEGVVLRADTPMAPGDRPVVKRKIAEFSELRFAGSRPWDPWTSLGPTELHQVAAGMVNPARLAGARSKVGPGSVPALLEEVVLDVLIDLGDALPATMRSLSPAGEAILSSHIRDLAVRLLQPGGPVG